MAIVYGANYGTPTLDLNFAKNKSLIDTISGRNLVTFTRASTGTYVGADGLIKTARVNEARFDHNPLTGECLGLLVEEARTNLNPFSASTYNGLANVTANSALAPDGTFTAAALQPPASSNPGGIHELYGVYPNLGTISVGNTISVYAKRNPGSAMKYLVLRLLTSGFINYYNLETGVVTVNDGSMPGSMTDAGNGWWRCQLTCNISGGGGNFLRTFVSTVLSVAPQTNGDPIYLWGVQHEAGAFPTSYIPTTGSTVTRSADVASITGSNYASFINYNEGTWVSSVPKVNGTGGRIFDSRPAILFASANTSGYSYNSGGAISINASYPLKGSLVYNSTDVHGAANGLINTGNTGGRAINHTYIDIGSANTAAAGVGFLNGPINRLTYYPTRLQDLQLQQLTK